MAEPTFEQVNPDHSSSFRCLHRSCSDLATDHPWHFHPQYELSWVIQSTGYRYVGNYVKPYQANEVVLYGPNLPHCSRNDPDTNGQSPVEYITLQFGLDCFGDGFLDLPESRGVKTLLARSSRALLFDRSAALRVGPTLRELVGSTGLPRLLKLITVLHELSEIDCQSLTSENYRDEFTLDRNLVSQLNQVQSYIDAHFRGFVSQADLAANLGLSPSAFSKFVRAATGQTFMSLVQIARINEACRLLCHGNDRITDVALECGYQHTSHFDRTFRELKGISPTAYRQRVRALGGRPTDASLAKVA